MSDHDDTLQFREEPAGEVEIIGGLDALVEALTERERVHMKMGTSADDETPLVLVSVDGDVFGISVTEAHRLADHIEKSSNRLGMTELANMILALRYCCDSLEKSGRLN